MRQYLTTLTNGAIHPFFVVFDNTAAQHGEQGCKYRSRNTKKHHPIEASKRAVIHHKRSTDPGGTQRHTGRRTETDIAKIKEEPEGAFKLCRRRTETAIRSSKNQRNTDPGGVQEEPLSSLEEERRSHPSKHNKNNESRFQKEL